MTPDNASQLKRSTGRLVASIQQQQTRGSVCYVPCFVLKLRIYFSSPDNYLPRSSPAPVNYSGTPTLPRPAMSPLCHCGDYTAACNIIQLQKKMSGLCKKYKCSNQFSDDYFCCCWTPGQGGRGVILPALNVLKALFLPVAASPSWLPITILPHC